VSWTTIIQFAMGGVLLMAGAELLVRGASRLALAAGISPLVVGLTIVAFGTSSPELAVTVGGAYSGQSDVALGNVVGSNIFNVLLILGLAAMITPLVVAQQLVRLDVPVMIGASVAALLMALDGSVGRIDGALLFTGGVGYTWFLIRSSRRETAAVRAEYDEAFGAPPPAARSRRWPLDLALIAGGLVMLVAGSRWLVSAAVATAEALGVSQLVIGLTIVAAGTSLPEVATSVLAAVRGERDIAVGNVVGSNVFNLLVVLGLGSVVAPNGIPVTPGALTFDIPVMIAVAAACLPVFFVGYRIERWEGLLFLAYYIAYVVYLILTSTAHAAVPAFRTAMLYFALPLTAVTLTVVIARALVRMPPRIPR
jgi:cation:H+ antiporter